VLTVVHARFIIAEWYHMTENKITNENQARSSNLSIKHNVLASAENRLTTNFIPRCLSSHYT